MPYPFNSLEDIKDFLINQWKPYEIQHELSKSDIGHTPASDSKVDSDYSHSDADAGRDTEHDYWDDWPGIWPTQPTTPVNIPLEIPPPPIPEEEDDDTENQIFIPDEDLDDPPGNDIVVNNEPEGKRGGAFAFPSPLELVLGTRTHQRWSGKFDPCKALKERSHVRYEKSFRRPGKQKLPRATAIKITYYNRSKCK